VFKAPPTTGWLNGYIAGLAFGLTLGFLLTLAFLKWFPPAGNPIGL